MPANTTQFSEIFRLFLAQIDDYELGIIADTDEFEEVLTTYLENALESLQEFDIDFETVDFEGRKFGEKLTRIQKNIVAKSMTLEWVRTRVLRAELMERDIGDRDHSAVQGDRYIRELIPLQNRLDEDVRQMVIDYSWQNEF